MNRIREALIFLILPLLIFACSSTKVVIKPPQLTFDDPILSKGIDDKGTKGIPLNPTAVFSTQDPKVIASLKLKNLSGRHTLRCDWYDPNGNLYYSTGNRPIEAPGEKYLSEATAWHSLSIQGEKAAKNPGLWKVRFYFDREFIASKGFTIESDAKIALEAPVPLPLPPTPKLPPSLVPPVPPALRGVRWAVVIGISGYKDTRIPTLRYASDDANSFYNWLISPKGGKYAPANVKLLLNKNATNRNFKSALFVWLKRALKEDMVTIYFAGHGSPESPDSPNNLFLLPYDTQYDNIAATGFPMWDIGTALDRFIKAKKVVIIADACHAGGIGQSFDVARRSNRAIRVNPVGTRLQDLSKVEDGVCVISASSEKQLSQESENWGGGHGVFTYFLLKALKGDADYNNDNRVTLGELILYVPEQVRSATKNAQSPIVSGKFDTALSIGR